MNFSAFINDIVQNRWEVYGVEVYSDGKLLHRFGDTTDHRHPIYSATKSITAIAAGMAVDEGRLDITKSVIDYLPADAVRKMPKTQLSVYRSVTVQRLMSMSVDGYPFRPSGSSWLETALNTPLPNVNERVFSYSNVSAYLVGVAVSCALKEDLYSYLTRKLFEPLGISEPPFARCPDGYFYGASSMELTVNELSRIGRMLYQGGVYEGQRLLSESFVRDASSIQQINREGGYGYFFWKYLDGFSINGKWKQKCYILPAKKLMITYLSNIQDSSCTIRESMEKHLLAL